MKFEEILHGEITIQRPPGHGDAAAGRGEHAGEVPLTRRVQFNVWIGVFQPSRAFTHHWAALVTQVELSMAF